MSDEERGVTSLYRYYDGHGNLLYVGITSRGQRRMDEHSGAAAWWLACATCTIEHFPTRAAAAAAEMESIRGERPRFNVVGTVLPRSFVSERGAPVEVAVETLDGLGHRFDGVRYVRKELRQVMDAYLDGRITVERRDAEIDRLMANERANANAAQSWMDEVAA